MSWGHWLESRGQSVEDLNVRKKTYYEGLARELGIVTKKRDRDVVTLRYLFWCEAQRVTGMSFSAIGKLTGGHDHSSVSHGIRKVKEFKASKDKEVLYFEKEFNKIVAEYEKGNCI